MTDEAWAKGMSELAACLPDQEASPERKAVRGVVYRDELGHLSNAQWLQAVRLAIQNERWFPTVAALLSYADEVRPTALELPSHIPTAQEIEERRQSFRRGFEQARRELCSRGIHIGCNHEQEPVAEIAAASQTAEKV